MPGMIDITTYMIGVVVIVVLPGPKSLFERGADATSEVGALFPSFSARLAAAAVN